MMCREEICAQSDISDDMLEVCLQWKMIQPKGLSINNLRNLAPRFGPDLDGTIEKKPRHSLDYVEVFSIEARSKMARRWDARWEGYVLTGPKDGS